MPEGPVPEGLQGSLSSCKTPVPLASETLNSFSVVTLFPFQSLLSVLSLSTHHHLLPSFPFWLVLCLLSFCFHPHYSANSASGVISTFPISWSLYLIALASLLFLILMATSPCILLPWLPGPQIPLALYLRLPASRFSLPLCWFSPWSSLIVR